MKQLKVKEDRLEQPSVGSCPVCHTNGQKVPLITVKSLLKKSPLAEEEYAICLNPECEIVYFGKTSLYNKQDLSVKVWFKEKTPPVPICYCKNVTDQDILHHIQEEKCCASLEDIQKHTGANTGNQCVTLNPIGK